MQLHSEIFRVTITTPLKQIFCRKLVLAYILLNKVNIILNICFQLWNTAALSTDDESPYPASNGGYYNRKVYSDSYFAPAHTLRRPKKDQHSRKNSQENNPPDLVSPNSSHGQPVYARVGPPVLSWRNGSPGLTSFTPNSTRHVYHGSSRSEPGNML